MKALVGKILRGTYPPISSTYSSDLRDMIGKMLQKDPRDRPSINSVLKIPFIQKRMEFLLSKGEPETSGEKLQEKTPSGVSSPVPEVKVPPSAFKDNRKFSNVGGMPLISNNNNNAPVLAKYERDIVKPTPKLVTPSVAPKASYINDKMMEEKRRKQLQEQREREKERLLKLQKEKEQKMFEEEQRMKDIADRKREYELRQKQYAEEKLERERKSIYEEAR